MAQIELIMPKMGESVAEATIIKWLKNEGDTIEQEESVLEIATDKVDSEIPAPDAGILIKKLYNEGDVVKVGQAIAIIGSEGTTPSVKSTPTTEITPANDKTADTETSKPLTESAHKSIIASSATGRFYSPLVRSIAAKEGIDTAELDTIEGSGKEGRVTKQDLLAYLPNRGTNTIKTNTTQRQEQTEKPTTTSTQYVQGAIIKKPDISINPGDEIIEMDRMRKLIAEHMVMSKHVSPHVTSFIEVDVTNMVIWREKVKNAFQKRENEKITFTPLFIEAIVKAIKDLPLINISVDGDKIIKRKRINIGMATALPSGNLIVPVVKDADQKNLIGLTKAVNDLSARARNNKLQPDEIQGGTFTLTNVGTFGNVMGTPIINQPQVAIMATGAIRKKPAVIETPFGDTIGIRHMMFLSMSYDHRVVDGSLGGSFIKKVADYMEAFDINRDF
ncbi:MAG: 2-oxo acid dehydrogenase subunit E2 [Bacteroidetes bacterium]|nr:2-oxo acid dehydrogenase subunit E2 [Bacteroidota bacterium]MBV6461934.1 Dihydrolipoyllysine-residue succinyltransferase component of 2-oxoglutarate dehydrogenase complex [Flavobacteriales bacterium]WKZ74501.1 MAG: dihydrolipoamide acetyltransferase family protein [Vicingaceae bacterium]MCL4816232.1 2-oxo acid dehydrogenase subunit E2 [Flavobacteriales bacterium]NOG95115.1 2-oxo acid dehydrogenase subunit E2 [Bacteroidota bacterium]